MGAASKEEYDRLIVENARVSGEGIMGVTQHMPCPFCAEPDWLVARIIDFEQAIAEDHTCSSCGRSAKALVERTAGGVAFEIVQTGGEDQPPWLTPEMRRVDQEGADDGEAGE